MKCRYCGYNLGLEDRFCPHCGQKNDQAAGHIADMDRYREEYEQTRESVITSSTRFNARTGRGVVIAIMMLLTCVMLVITRNYSDIETREQSRTRKIENNVEKNRDTVTEALKEMEINRDYLGMDYYILEYRLRGDDNYSDYSRVFTAAICYKAIYNDILNIIDGFDGYEGKTDKDWCNDIAIYLEEWSSFVDGEFWYDTADSEMHSGEHGSFIRDCKKDTQDLVQVYFELSDQQASSLWSMDRDAIASMLYEKCREIYPGGDSHE